MAIGRFTFVLHSHLPYVLSHGSWPHGTDWLNEATAESYIPILAMLDDLVEEGVEPRLTIGITPVLTEQIADRSFKEGFETYLEAKIAAAREDKATFKSYGNDHMAALADMWEGYYTDLRNRYMDRYNTDLVGAFRRLQDGGHIEIITCAATHGYLPLLSRDESIQAQIRTGIQSYKQHYGRDPMGVWLPECAYRPAYRWAPPPESGHECAPYPRKGIEEFLAENGLQYFIVDSHLLKGGKAIGVYLDRFEALAHLWERFESQHIFEDQDRSPYECYLVASPGSKVGGNYVKKPVAVYTRDAKTGLQVWSGKHGYPGDGNYLDFHKKHFPGGHRYWKVTKAEADLADKMPYDPEEVKARLEENASHFAWLVETVLSEHREATGKVGILCAPFDTELFGHWWFEGPQFLKKVLRKLHLSDKVELTTCSADLEERRPREVISIPEGSWGEGGFHYIWLNEWTHWTWKHVYEAEAEMRSLVREAGQEADGNLRALLQQAAREILLLQSSDWQFLISTWSARDYAEQRISEHFQAFKELARLARKVAGGDALSDGEQRYVAALQIQDHLFPEIEPAWFGRVDFPAEDRAKQT